MFITKSTELIFCNHAHSQKLASVKCGSGNNVHESIEKLYV